MNGGHLHLAPNTAGVDIDPDETGTAWSTTTQGGGVARKGGGQPKDRRVVVASIGAGDDVLEPGPHGHGACPFPRCGQAAKWHRTDTRRRHTEKILVCWDHQATSLEELPPLREPNQGPVSVQLLMLVDENPDGISYADAGRALRILPTEVVRLAKELALPTLHGKVHKAVAGPTPKEARAAAERLHETMKPPVIEQPPKRERKPRAERKPKAPPVSAMAPRVARTVAPTPPAPMVPAELAGDALVIDPRAVPVALPEGFVITELKEQPWLRQAMAGDDLPITDEAPPTVPNVTAEADLPIGPSGGAVESLEVSDAPLITPPRVPETAPVREASSPPTGTSAGASDPGNEPGPAQALGDPVGGDEAAVDGAVDEVTPAELAERLDVGALLQPLLEHDPEPSPEPPMSDTEVTERDPVSPPADVVGADDPPPARGGPRQTTEQRVAALCQLLEASDPDGLPPWEVCERLQLSESRLRQIVGDSKGKVRAKGHTSDRRLVLATKGPPRPPRPPIVRAVSEVGQAILDTLSHGLWQTAVTLRRAVGVERKVFYREVLRLGESELVEGRGKAKGRSYRLGPKHPSRSSDPQRPGPPPSPPEAQERRKVAEGPGALGKRGPSTGTVEEAAESPSLVDAGASPGVPVRVTPGPVAGPRSAVDALLDVLEELDREVLANTYGLRADNDTRLDQALFAWRRAKCPRSRAAAGEQLDLELAHRRHPVAAAALATGLEEARARVVELEAALVALGGRP